MACVDCSSFCTQHRPQVKSCFALIHPFALNTGLKCAASRLLAFFFVSALHKKQSEYTHFVTELKKHFKLKELGPVSSFLGVSVHRDRSKRLLTLSQAQYATNVLQEFGFGDCSPVATPLDPGSRLSKDQAPKNNEEREFMRNKPYSMLVGALMYLAVATRPDLAHLVRVLIGGSDPAPHILLFLFLSYLFLICLF